MSRSLQLDQLTQLSRAFTYAVSLGDILDLAVKQAAEMLSAEKAILLLADDEGVLQVRSSYGVSSESVQRYCDSLDESLVSRLRGVIGTHLAEGFVGVPLVSNGNVIGLLAVLRPDLEVPSEEDEWLLSAIADQISAPVENARLSAELERAELISENGRLYQAELAARKEAERARAEADNARRLAETAAEEAEAARDLAQQSDRSKAAFLAAMSHDLRTPLNAIAGYVQLLKMGIRGPVTEEQLADLDRIARSQRHLLALVSEVLDFAKAGAGRVTYDMKDVDIGSSVRDAAAMVGHQLEEKGIVFENETADLSVRLRTDAHKLQQILINLLTNAVKFTPPGGRVSTKIDLSPEEEPPVARIHVSDTGEGINAENIESVFLPFVQINRTLNRPDEGIGLGLAISRELARGLGGDLTVASEPGMGARFTLALPLARSPVSATESSSSL